MLNLLRISMRSYAFSRNAKTNKQTNKQTKHSMDRPNTHVASSMYVIEFASRRKKYIFRKTRPALSVVFGGTCER